MEDERNMIKKVVKAVKFLPLWLKLTIFVPLLIIGLVLFYALFTVEISLDPVVCGYEQNCDGSLTVAPIKNEGIKNTQEKYQVKLATGNIQKSQVKKVAAESDIPYQRSTNSAVTDFEFRTLATKMKEARDSINSKGLTEDAETYGSVTYVPPADSTQDEESNKAGETPPVEDKTKNTDGDKIVAEAYKIYNEHGVSSSDPWIYSQARRYENGFSDCSAFVNKVYKNAMGIDVGPTTIGQIAKNYKDFHAGSDQLANLKPGDIMYFDTGGGHTQTIGGKTISVSHTGLYIGDNKYIDMSTYTSDKGYNLSDSYIPGTFTRGGKSIKGGISIKEFGPGQKFEKSTKNNFIGFIRIGEPGTGGGTLAGGQTYDEADIHIRALANTDTYALKGAEENLFKKDKNGNFVLLDGKKVLQDDYKNTMVEKTYLVSLQLKEDGRLSTYAGEKRTKKWSETDWMLNTRLLAYSCYMLGDEYVASEGDSGLTEWIGNLWGKGLGMGACTQLDNALSTATDGKQKSYISKDDWGVLTHTYTKTEYSYTCKPKPPEPPKDDSAGSDTGSGSGSSDGGSGGSGSGTSEPPIHLPGGGPLSAKGQKGVATLVNHHDIVVGKNQYPNCEYGYIEHVEKTIYPEFPSNYSGAKEKSVLKNFEKYSLIIPGKTTSKGVTYPTELERVLFKFYGDSLNSNEDLLITVGGGEPFIVPMEDGTYNFSSPFGPRDGKLHKGDDMGTLEISGVPIYSTANGVVVSTGFVNGYGYTVMVKHDNGYYSFYAHMNEDYIVVKKDQVVRQAQLIGGVDGQGDEDGKADLARHLHFEVCETAVTAASGNLMCAQHVDPEKDDDKVDARPDEVNLTFNTDEDTAKANKMATKFLGEWKEKAKSGTIYIMPGFSAVTGSLSEAYENKEGGCVNNSGDPGGISCGFYQFANSSGSICNFVHWMDKHGYDEYYNYFSPYCPTASSHVPSEFMDHWAALKKDGKYPADFKTAQFLATREKFYDYGANQLMKNFNLNPNDRHVAVQEMVWSITVQQYSQINFLFTTAGFSKSTDWASVTDREIITKVYDARIATVDRCFSRSSQAIKNSVRNRFIKEKQDALALLGDS